MRKYFQYYLNFGASCRSELWKWAHERMQKTITNRSFIRRRKKTKNKEKHLHFFFFDTNKNVCLQLTENNPSLILEMIVKTRNRIFCTLSLLNYFTNRLIIYASHFVLLFFFSISRSFVVHFFFSVSFLWCNSYGVDVYQFKLFRRTRIFRVVFFQVLIDDSNLFIHVRNCLSVCVESCFALFVRQTKIKSEFDWIMIENSPKKKKIPMHLLFCCSCTKKVWFIARNVNSFMIV